MPGLLKGRSLKVLRMMALAIAMASSSLALPTSAQENPLNAALTKAKPPSFPSQGFTAEQISYFLEIAMGAEFSSTSARIHKWSGEVRIQSFGNPTSQDLNSLDAVIADVNELTDGRIHLRIVNENPNVTIYFVPESQFSHYESNYKPTNYGFFWTEWSHQLITQANILIATDRRITPKERSHLIREELTQSLGLMQDSWRYPDSLFYQGWSDPTQYSAMDQALIQMLYHPAIQAGMSRAEAIAALQSLPLPDWANRPPLKF